MEEYGPSPGGLSADWLVRRREAAVLMYIVWMWGAAITELAEVRDRRSQTEQETWDVVDI